MQRRKREIYFDEDTGNLSRAWAAEAPRGSIGQAVAPGRFTLRAL